MNMDTIRNLVVHMRNAVTQLGVMPQYYRDNLDNICTLLEREVAPKTTPSAPAACPFCNMNIYKVDIRTSRNRSHSFAFTKGKRNAHIALTTAWVKATDDPDPVSVESSRVTVIKVKATEDGILAALNNHASHPKQTVDYEIT
jgi:hypothetical protein